MLCYEEYKSGNSVGYDELSTKLVKNIASMILEPFILSIAAKLIDVLLGNTRPGA